MHLFGKNTLSKLLPYLLRQLNIGLLAIGLSFITVLHVFIRDPVGAKFGKTGIVCDIYVLLGSDDN